MNAFILTTIRSNDFRINNRNNQNKQSNKLCVMQIEKEEEEDDVIVSINGGLLSKIVY